MDRFWIVLVAVFILMTTVCGNEIKESFPVKNYEVTVWSNGKEETAMEGKDDEIHQAMIQVLKDVTDRPRLYVDSERVEALLAKEDLWEVKYHEPVRVQIGRFGEQSIQRILSPLTGDLAQMILTQTQDGSWDIWM